MSSLKEGVFGTLFIRDICPYFNYGLIERSGTVSFYTYQ